MADALPLELPTGYYHENFIYVLDFVAAQYGDLLSRAEQDYVTGFRQMSLDAQRLYVRLCGRKGPLFRSDKLNYAEISSLDDAIDELTANQYLNDGADADLADLLALLTLPELRVLGEGRIGKQLPRSEVIGACCELFDPSEIHGHVPFRILRPLKLEHLQVFKLLFFGNLQQDFTDFVLRDLGISPFETYEILERDRFFASREVVEESLAWYAIGDAAESLMREGEAEALVEFARTIPDASHPQLERRSARLKNRIARQLERFDYCAEAQKLYECSCVAPARERRARLHHKSGDLNGALALCDEILADPEDEAEYEFARGFGHRIARKAGTTWHGTPVRTRVETLEIAVAPVPNTRVEALAAGWFESSGHSARYVENGLFNGLFGLAFWDIIFMPVRGAFFNPLQRGPADLFLPEFRQARFEAIEARIQALADPAFFREQVLNVFAAKAGIANHFVFWDIFDPPLLDQVFTRIPNEHILEVFKRLLRDLRNNRSGFPDLVVFPPDDGYLLAEVKGPGDTLQDNQKRWLRFFAETGVPATVVNVQWM